VLENRSFWQLTYGFSEFILSLFAPDIHSLTRASPDSYLQQLQRSWSSPRIITDSIRRWFLRWVGTDLKEFRPISHWIPKNINSDYSPVIPVYTIHLVALSNRPIKMVNHIFSVIFLSQFISFVNALACSSIKDIEVPGAKILSITGITRTNVSVAASPVNPLITGLNICDVTLILTHPGANDTVTVEVWLPISGWNGRFQATGGGGFSVGLGPSGMGPAVAGGYAAASTDGGNLGAGSELLPNALVDGHVNWPLVLNYGSRSVHDMTVIGKAATQKYYGKSAKYSYFTGCSNGGREGYISAQLYPDDFDGILATSPVVNEPEIGISVQWPYVVMQNEGKALSQCIFQVFINASIALCDSLDGVEDGIIGNLAACHFDPFKLVGQRVICDGTTSTIDYTTSKIFSKIYNGPTAPNGSQLWNGLNTGTGFNGMSEYTLFWLLVQR
jgi:Tannase and feruloyl esterase